MRVDPQEHRRRGDPLCAKLSNARFWRVFASLLGPCLDQPWLGQGPNGCNCVACWNVCPARGKDVSAIAKLGGDNVDDWLGVAWLYFCALRNVEGTTKKIEELQA